MAYDGIIFDKDGVLLDSAKDNFLWADRLRVKNAREKGHEITMTEAKSIVKADNRKEIEEVADKTGLALSDIKYIERKVSEGKIKKIENGEIELFQETIEVLENLDKSKALVSNAPYKATEFVLKYFELQNYFKSVYSPKLDSIKTYTEKKKPNSKMVDKAINDMNADKPVMVGDSSKDIQAAKNAGIDSIHLETNGGTDLEPTYSVNNLKDILDIMN